MVNWVSLKQGWGAIAAGSIAAASIVIGSVCPVWAQPSSASGQWVAQSVVDGLPPPPGGTGLGTGVPPTLPTVQTAPPTGASPSGGSFQPTPTQYLVVINGDSLLLLSQVQAVEPLASVQTVGGDRLIQAGRFSDAAAAQQQVNRFATMGITAEVKTITADGQLEAASAPAPQSSVAASQPIEIQPSSSPTRPTVAANPADSPRQSAYYVVIPGSRQNLPDIRDQVLRLTTGLGMEPFVQIDDGLASHVEVGPFVDRQAARRWTRYFRDFGLDAQVDRQ